MPSDYDECVLGAVVTALGRAEGVDPAALEYALYEWVEPDALVALWTGSPGFIQCSFEVAGHEVTVSDDGTITVDGTRYAIDDLCDRSRGDGA